MAEIKDTEWAYAAGFVDGEGCIAVVRQFVELRGRFYYSVQVVVSNRDRSVLEWMQATWGGAVVAVSARAGAAKNCWNWRLASTAAKPFLEGLRPWLRIKSHQCDNALLMIDSSSEDIEPSVERHYRRLG